MPAAGISADPSSCSSDRRGRPKRERISGASGATELAAEAAGSGLESGSGRVRPGEFRRRGGEFGVRDCGGNGGLGSNGVEGGP